MQKKLETRTAASEMEGWVCRMFSTSMLEMFSPPLPGQRGGTIAQSATNDVHSARLLADAVGSSHSCIAFPPVPPLLNLPDDDILAAVSDLDAPILMLHRQVPRVEPPALERRLGRLLVLHRAEQTTKDPTKKSEFIGSMTRSLTSSP